MGRDGQLPFDCLHAYTASPSPLLMCQASPACPQSTPPYPIACSHAPMLPCPHARTLPCLLLQTHALAGTLPLEWGTSNAFQQLTLLDLSGNTWSQGFTGEAQCQRQLQTKHQPHLTAPGWQLIPVQ